MRICTSNFYNKSFSAQPLVIIKITTLVILLSIFQVNANTYAQKISIQKTNVALPVIIDEIRKQSGYDFIFDANLLSKLKPITVHIRESTVEDVLENCLRRQPLSYTIKDKFVVLKFQNLPESSLPVMRQRQLNGQVTDEQHKPIPGVTVKILNTSTAVITKEDGKYNISLRDEKPVLIFSCIGYESQTIVVGQRTEINVILKEQHSNLNEVVVVGYGTQARKDVTTAVSSLGADDLNNFPSTGVDKAMTGKLAGVQVMTPNGAPGAGISIHVRGTGTITAGAEPLYVVDDVPLSDNDNNGPGFKVNALNAINVNDIESVDVLKDASAAAIYGSRGSNGVVIITTKRGKKDQLNISLNSYYGLQSVTKKIPMLNAAEYAQLIYDAHNATYFDQLAAKGLTGNATDDNATRLNKLGAAATNTSLAYLLPAEIFPYLNGQSGLTNTNWQNEIFRNAPMQSYTLSAAGGSEKLNFYISGNFLNQDGIVINSGYKKYAARVNIDATYGRLKLGTSTNYNYSIYRYLQTEGAFNNANQNIIGGALAASPFFPVFNADGSYNYDQFRWQYSQSTGVNPVALAMLKNDETYEKKFLSNIFGEYSLIKELKYRVSFGVNISDFNRSVFNPSTLPNPLTLTTPSNPTGNYVTNQITNWIVENTLSYIKRWNDHSLQALAGFSLQRERSSATNISGTGYPNDLVKTMNGATTLTNNITSFLSSGINEWSLLSGLSRLQYSYQEKYLLSAALRTDGSSRFGPNNKYGYFPSASVGWILTNEEFLKSVRAISSMKLRASYGVTGNFQIGNYAYLSTLAPANYILGANGGSLSPGLYQNTAGNPDLGWEKTSATNIGLDLGLFKGVLNATIDVYNNNTSDLLLNIPVPLSTGYATNLVNIGRVNNKGAELTLSSSNTIGKLRISNSVNYSANRNRVRDLGGVNSIITQTQGVIYFITQVGQPIGNYYTLKQTGIFKDQAEIDQSKARVPGAKPGDLKFADINADGIIDGKDKTITGNYQPKFIYGYSGQAQYGMFDLNVSAQGVYGNTIANIAQRHYNSGESYANNTTDILNRWKSPADPGNGINARANRSQTGLNAQISTYHLSPGSYFRVRELTMGFTLPEKTAKAARIAGLRLYVSALNPFTFTRYNGYNPEVSIDNNQLTPGIDYGSYPVSKTFLLGFNVKL